MTDTRGIDAATERLLKEHDVVRYVQIANWTAADIVCPHAKGDVVYDYLVNRMHWEGEVIYYTKRGHVHVAMPNFEVKADHMIVDS